MIEKFRNDPDESATVASVEAAIIQTTISLHGIRSRTLPSQVAHEVVRLNNAVRTAATAKLGPFDQPADFLRLLMSAADTTNSGGRP